MPSKEAVKPDHGADGSRTVDEIDNTTQRYGKDGEIIDNSQAYSVGTAKVRMDNAPEAGAVDSSEGIVLNFSDGINTVPEMLAAGGVAVVALAVIGLMALGFSKRRASIGTKGPNE